MSAPKKMRPSQTHAQSIFVPPVFNFIPADSKAFSKLYDIIEKIIDKDIHVLITGKTGSGKESIVGLFAIYNATENKPFVAINCAAIPDTLLEAQLFGVAKGAFTGADHDVDGLFTKANGGILFLDEINSLPLHLQPKVLRAIEYGEIYPVGETTARHVHTRIVAATNTDLRELAQQGLFRADLYYRLNEIEVIIPELDSQDIVKYGRYFIHHFGKAFNKEFGDLDEFENQILQKQWAGGIREIKNVIKRSVLLSQDHFELALPVTESAASSQSAANARSDIRPHASTLLSTIIPLEQLEAEAIAHALKVTGWNIPSCAHQLGIGDSTLRRKIKTYGLKANATGFIP